MPPRSFSASWDVTCPAGVSMVVVGIGPGRAVGVMLSIAVFDRLSFNLFAAIYRSTILRDVLEVTVTPSRLFSVTAMKASST